MNFLDLEKFPYGQIFGLNLCIRFQKSTIFFKCCLKLRLYNLIINSISWVEIILFDMLLLLENLIQQKVWSFNLLCQIYLKTSSNLNGLLSIIAPYLILLKFLTKSHFLNVEFLLRDSKHHLRKKWRPKHSNLHLDSWLEL